MRDQSVEAFVEWLYEHNWWIKRHMSNEPMSKNEALDLAGHFRNGWLRKK